MSENAWYQQKAKILDRTQWLGWETLLRKYYHTEGVCQVWWPNRRHAYSRQRPKERRLPRRPGLRRRKRNRQYWAGLPGAPLAESRLPCARRRPIPAPVRTRATRTTSSALGLPPGLRCIVGWGCCPYPFCCLLIVFLMMCLPRIRCVRISFSIFLPFLVLIRLTNSLWSFTER